TCLEKLARADTTAPLIAIRVRREYEPPKEPNWPDVFSGMSSGSMVAHHESSTEAERFIAEMYLAEHRIPGSSHPCLPRAGDDAQARRPLARRPRRDEDLMPGRNSLNRRRRDALRCVVHLVQAGRSLIICDPRHYSQVAVSTFANRCTRRPRHEVSP